MITSPYLDKPVRSEAQAKRDIERAQVLKCLGRLWGNEVNLRQYAQTDAAELHHEENVKALTVALRVLEADRTWEV